MYTFNVQCTYIAPLQRTVRDQGDIRNGPGDVRNSQGDVNDSQGDVRNDQGRGTLG
jgi:hypothetical protein